MSRHLIASSGIGVPIVLGALLSSAPSASAQLIWEEKVYVKMDFWQPVNQQSAEAWHFDPNNARAWTKLPNHPNPPDLRGPRAKFEVRELFPDEFLNDLNIWFLGVPSIRIVAGEPGSYPGNFTDVSALPQYRHMLDVMVMNVEPSHTLGGAIDPCGSSVNGGPTGRLWPIAAGPELTPYHLFPHSAERGGFGMRMIREALVGSVTWRWSNPANVAQENVYVEFTLRYDLKEDTRDPEDRHINVHVSWISAGGGCAYDFCIDEGASQKFGSPFAPEAYSVVVAVPHVQDHADYIALNYSEGSNLLVISHQVPNNSPGESSAHKCQPDGTANPWHTHSPGASGHLRLGGLGQWHGRFFLQTTSTLVATAGFDVPAHSVADTINQRALWLVFWDRLSPPEE